MSPAPMEIKVIEITSIAIWSVVGVSQIDCHLVIRGGLKYEIMSVNHMRIILDINRKLFTY